MAESTPTTTLKRVGVAVSAKPARLGWKALPLSGPFAFGLLARAVVASKHKAIETITDLVRFLIVPPQMVVECLVSVPDDPSSQSNHVFGAILLIDREYGNFFY
jgi:hypothetical protein